MLKLLLLPVIFISLASCKKEMSAPAQTEQTAKNNYPELTVRISLSDTVNHYDWENHLPINVMATAKVFKANGTAYSSIKGTLTLVWYVDDALKIPVYSWAQGGVTQMTVEIPPKNSDWTYLKAFYYLSGITYSSEVVKVFTVFF